MIWTALVCGFDGRFGVALIKFGTLILTLEMPPTVGLPAVDLFTRRDRVNKANAIPSNTVQIKFRNISNFRNAKPLARQLFIVQGIAVMLVNTSVSKTLVLPEVTIRPKVTLVAMVNALVLTVTHAKPLVEDIARITLLVRVRLSQ